MADFLEKLEKFLGRYSDMAYHKNWLFYAIVGLGAIILIMLFKAI
jgi:uncharacterized membrane protein YuzA (DUF378 family)